MTTQDYARIQTARQLEGPRAPAARRSAETPKEAAQQFEQVLVRQFVKVMTKGLFDTSLSGEGGPQWMQGQRDTQRDMMTDMLTEHLAGTDALPIADQLTKQWDDAAPAPTAPTAPTKVPSLPVTDLKK